MDKPRLVFRPLVEKGTEIYWTESIGDAAQARNLAALTAGDARILRSSSYDRGFRGPAPADPPVAVATTLCSPRATNSSTLSAGLGFGNRTSIDKIKEIVHAEPIKPLSRSTTRLPEFILDPERRDFRPHPGRNERASGPRGARSGRVPDLDLRGDGGRWAATPSAIRIDGGMAANAWLCQCLADILEVAVERPRNSKRPLLAPPSWRASRQGSGTALTRWLLPGSAATSSRQKWVLITARSLSRGGARRLQGRCAAKWMPREDSNLN